MKKIIVLFLLVCNTLYLYANTNEQAMQPLFEKAAEAYQKKEYSIALFEYEKIVHQGYKSANVFYNIGNCHFRSGNYGSAIYYYEKSLKIKPNDKETLHNLNVANQRIIDKFERAPRFILFQYWENFHSLLSLNQWSYLILILFASLVVGIFFYLISSSFTPKKIYFFSCILALFLTILSFSAAWTSYQDSLKRFAIIMDSRISVKASPAYNSTDKTFIHQGCKVEILDQVGGFYKVELADLRTGWVPQNCLKII